MLTLSNISWTGIIAAALASFLLGGLWFTLLFGRAYARALGRAPDPKSRPAPLMIVGSALWGLITAFATAVLMARLGTGTLPEALELGLFLGCAYLAATTVNTGLNPNIPRPLLYGAISGAYHLAAALVTVAVLFAFQAGG